MDMWKYKLISYIFSDGQVVEITQLKKVWDFKWKRTKEVVEIHMILALRNE